MDNLHQVPQSEPVAPAAGMLLEPRHEFWLDTCREPVRRRTSSEGVLELYQRHGCRFETPSPQQVQDVLEALDAALPHWEQQHPELFFQTLELNFPELVRHA